jgi:hypothetical protein
VIVVLDGGRIVEVGSHSELVKRAGVYSQLFNEQTRKLRPVPEHIVRVPGSLSPAPEEADRTDFSGGPDTTGTMRSSPRSRCP